VRGQGQALQQWEVDVDIEALGLEAGKAVGNGLESGAHCVQMIKSLLQTKVAQIIGTKFGSIAQSVGKSTRSKHKSEDEAGQRAPGIVVF
jgi:hypothetical protein